MIWSTVVCSSCLQVFFKTGVLKNFAIFTRKHLCWSLFLILVLQPCNYIKKQLQHRCFPLNIAEFWRTSNLKNICEQLLLKFNESAFWSRNIILNFLWRMCILFFMCIILSDCINTLVIRPKNRKDKLEI